MDDSPIVEVSMSIASSTIHQLSPMQGSEITGSLAILKLGESSGMRKVRLQIDNLAPHCRILLITGEAGTGKQLVARALHQYGSQEQKRFVVCDMPSLSNLPETRAWESIEASMRSAERGTLFLKNIEQMPIGLQALLFVALGEKLNVKIIASTATELRSMVSAGRFHPDLYHRLATIEIALEPLRNRQEDIPALAMYFLEQSSSSHEQYGMSISQETINTLQQYPWPGNLLELEAVIRHGVQHCKGKELRQQDLSISPKLGNRGDAHSGQRVQDMPTRLQDVIERHVFQVLEKCRGNKVRAAEMLGISRSTLYRILEEEIGPNASSGKPTIN